MNTKNLSGYGVTRSVFLGLALVWATSSYAQTVDNFNPGADGAVYCTAIQPDGKVLVGGAFLNLGGQGRKHLGRLGSDGTLETSFDPGTDGTVNCIGVQANGKILVGGNFSTLGGQPRAKIGLLNEDGTVESTFNPNANGAITGLAVLPNGDIYVAGDFTTIGGQDCARIARLKADGSVDSSFNSSGANYMVNTLVVQEDGKVLVAGSFTTLAGSPCTDGLGRLNVDGSRDTGFVTSLMTYYNSQPRVLAVALQGNGKILVGGGFPFRGRYDGFFIRALNADGSMDTSVNQWSHVGSAVLSVATQADQKILVGSSGGTHIESGGYDFNKLLADGTIDHNFDHMTLNFSSDSVYSTTIQPDGKIILGGNISLVYKSLTSVPRQNIARLDNSDAATQSLSCDGTTIKWLRGGSCPEVYQTTFEVSTNGTDWVSLGAGTRILGGWQLTGQALTANALVRARGFVYSGSSWFVETTAVVEIPFKLHASDAAFGIRSNAFGFHFSGQSGQTVIVQTSPDLKNWTSVYTNSDGAAFFADPSWTNQPGRFYRAFAK